MRVRCWLPVKRARMRLFSTSKSYQIPLHCPRSPQTSCASAVVLSEPTSCQAGHKTVDALTPDYCLDRQAITIARAIQNRGRRCLTRRPCHGDCSARMPGRFVFTAASGPITTIGSAKRLVNGMHGRHWRRTLPKFHIAVIREP
jgi:hypothetical protein